jgi:hypothetical protein
MEIICLTYLNLPARQCNEDGNCRGESVLQDRQKRPALGRKDDAGQSFPDSEHERLTPDGSALVTDLSSQWLVMKSRKEFICTC